MARRSPEPYSEYDLREQRVHRMRLMRWQRTDWRSNVEDIVFAHEMLGVEAIHFSGDHRAAPREDSDLTCL